MKRTIFIVTLILFSIAPTLLITMLSYRNALRAADDFLQSQALGIASSLDSAISGYGTQENIFSDIIGAERWEGIAFLALLSLVAQPVPASDRIAVRLEPAACPWR